MFDYLLFLFLGLWAINWVYYSWRQKPLVFLQVGLLTAIQPLWYVSFIGLVIFQIITVLNFSWVVDQFTLTHPDFQIPDLVGRWISYGMVALDLFWWVLFFILNNYVHDKLKEIKK